MSEQFQRSQIPQPTIHLVYASPNFPKPDEVSIIETIRGIEPLPTEGAVDASWTYQESQRCLGQVQIGQHNIQVAGLASPIPQEIVDCTIHPSPWPPQVKAAMRQNLSHLSLGYTGGGHDPVEKMIALYKTAHAFENEDLLGILNENAWTAHPTGDTLNPEKICGYRKDIPFLLWIGYVKFFTNEKNYWLVTKGHHIFDVPDLAYYVWDGEDPDQIISHFINIFYYIYDQDVVVTAGDTLEISKRKQLLKFAEIPQGADFLMGPSGTLVIQKINSGEVNA